MHWQKIDASDRITGEIRLTSDDKEERFNSATDYRLAELTMNRMYKKSTDFVWSYVKWFYFIKLLKLKLIQ
ncbi:Hha/YmoA family nucleoid-associated regulatory protein [Brenneria uluponensis]|uniref:Hha/YmoA family nucleoid-associated regulatory protein n=1 Tax=Brenneria uluponensis TaxID=3057057 RepID=UPI0028F0E590|nr:Hha/YmoA family nucleoid-associated regulatory protein [Brenneria ulupoensis]